MFPLCHCHSPMPLTWACIYMPQKVALRRQEKWYFLSFLIGFCFFACYNFLNTVIDLLDRDYSSHQPPPSFPFHWPGKGKGPEPGSGQALLGSSSCMANQELQRRWMQRGDPTNWRQSRAWNMPHITAGRRSVCGLWGNSSGWAGISAEGPQ